MLYYWLVHNMDVTKTMLISLVTPVFAVTLGMLILHEELSWRSFAGGAMIMLGIGLIVVRRKREANSAVAELRSR
jgi:O-acetylserine/cysteine efflux transporter